MAAPLKTQEFRMVRQFSRAVRFSCVAMGAIMVSLALALLVLGWGYAEMVWMGVFNAILGGPLLFLGVRGTPWSHRLPWDRRPSNP